jgi:hypothetical protein
MTRNTSTSSNLRLGDCITIAGVHRPRMRWRRFIDWLLRRKPPPEPQVFRVTEVIISRSRAEFRIDTLFGRDQ